MLNIAVIGAGRIGRIHAHNVAHHEVARLAGVYDPHTPSAEALAVATGCKILTLEQAFAADAVLIGSPTDTHAGYIEMAARAGRPIFCEKPIDLAVARVEQALAVVHEAGVPLMVGFNRRFDPSFATLKRRLAAGEIGRLEMLTIISRDPAPPPASHIATSGGLFRDMMIHDLDLARFLMGEDVVTVYAAGSCLFDREIGDAGDVDTAMVTLTAASGALCQISNSRRAAYGYDQRIEAHGAGGLLRAGNQTATTVEVANSRGFTTDPALPFFLERYAAAYKAELDAFVDCVTGGIPAAPSGEDGLAALVLADAAVESVRTGQAVRVG